MRKLTTGKNWFKIKKSEIGKPVRLIKTGAELKSIYGDYQKNRIEPVFRPGIEKSSLK
jgi:hypothetical protein